MTDVIPISEAKANLSKLVKRAHSGEVIYLGAYGIAEAVLAPVPPRSRIMVGAWADKRASDFDYADEGLIGPDPEAHRGLRRGDALGAAMRFLLDSHVLVWLLFAPEMVGAEAKRALESAEQASISTVSLWELTLKHAKGRLPHSPEQLTAGVATVGAEELAIGHRHLVSLPQVELPHGDPFDAMLIAQSHTDGLTLLTADRHLLSSRYATMDVRR